jgi:hypothetical protein
MKVLFLDVDGVLNSWDWVARRVKDPLWHQLRKEEREAMEGLDPDAMARLNRIVDETKCLVVLSSTWRKDHSLTQLNRMFRLRGFKHTLFGTTPSIWLDGDDRGRKQRGGEIHWWLSQLDTMPVFAIVDDDSDMEPHMDRLVKTHYQYGLTDEIADKLVQLLNE